MRNRQLSCRLKSAVSRIHSRGMPVKSIVQFTTLFAVLLHPISAETVSGRVVDPSGAAINRATVTITAREGDIRRSIQTAGDETWHRSFISIRGLSRRFMFFISFASTLPNLARSGKRINAVNGLYLCDAEG